MEMVVPRTETEKKMVRNVGGSIKGSAKVQRVEGSKKREAEDSVKIR